VPECSLPLSNMTHVGILESGSEQIVPIQDLRNRFSVDALIRLHYEDFRLISDTCRFLVHFNLEITLNVVGCRYAIVPIVKAGQRLVSGDEVLPVVDPTRFRRGVCQEVIQRLPIDQVTPEQFAHSLPNIKNPDQLRKALLHRYRRMFPDLAKDEILEKGCAITKIIFDIC
jgi:hypothetical protein